MRREPRSMRRLIGVDGDAISSAPFRTRFETTVPGLELSLRYGLPNEPVATGVSYVWMLRSHGPALAATTIAKHAATEAADAPGPRRRNTNAAASTAIGRAR